MICFLLYQKNQRAIDNNSTRHDAMTVLLNTHGKQAILNSNFCGIGNWDMPLSSPSKRNELLCCGCSNYEHGLIYFAFLPTNNVYMVMYKNPASKS